MAFLKWLAGGLIGAAIGGAVWVLIGYFLNMEVGYIAWGIGLLAGIGVRAAADEEGAMTGITAVLSAVVVIALSKYMVVSLLVDHEISNVANFTFTNEDVTIGFAYDIVDEREAEGKTIQWPLGMTFDDVSEPSHFPPDIWQEAQQRFDALSEEEVEEIIAERQEFASEIAGAFVDAAKEEAFKESFAGFDLLWFGLAAFTAFRVGCGGDD